MQRRKQLIHQSAERKAIIASRYKRKHPEVYVLQVDTGFEIYFEPKELAEGLFLQQGALLSLGLCAVLELWQPGSFSRQDSARFVAG